MTAEAAPRGRFVAVDGGAAADGATAAPRQGERRALARRLVDAARRSALAQARGIGLLWSAHTGLVVALLPWTWVGSAWVAPLAWALAAGAAAAALLLWHGARERVVAPRVFIAVVSLGALSQALPPWLAPAGAAPTFAFIAAGVGAASAVVMAVWPAAAAAAAAVPLLACAGLAQRMPMSTALLVGAACTSTAFAACLMRRRAWLQTTRTIIEQADRVRDLEHERDEAWRTDREKSRFLAIASHDLRQPVHALGLFAASLHKRLAHSPDEPLARNLMRAIDALERSFNVMLDISKLDAGALASRPQTFALRDMFRRLHMQFAGQADLAGLGLRFSPGGKAVTSDPQLLERIVGNLIQNAVKYTARGGIVVVARSTAERINIEVWDTGCGIAPANLPLIFDEFYQVGRGERDRAHGLGMGLAIVKRLAALLGHRLEVASVLGRGTMFRVGVPIGGLPGIQEDLAPADTQPMSASSPQVVLVIDDEEPIREGLRVLLLEWGFQPMTAADADQAERAVQALEGQVDLVLSDLHLGAGPDGVEAIAAVRRLCGREVPAILVTGDTAREQVQRLASAGAAVLVKPVLPRQLFNAVRDALR